MILGVISSLNSTHPCNVHVERCAMEILLRAGAITYFRN